MTDDDATREFPPTHDASVGVHEIDTTISNTATYCCTHTLTSISTRGHLDRR